MSERFFIFGFASLHLCKKMAVKQFFFLSSTTRIFVCARVHTHTQTVCVCVCVCVGEVRWLTENSDELLITFSVIVVLFLEN